MKLQFDMHNNVEDFTFILSTKWYEHQGILTNVKRDTVTCKQNLNGANELSFEVCKTLNGEDERLWDEIKSFKSVWVKELNEYFEIYVSLDDSITPTKIITGTSMCEAELGQVILYNIEINTEADIERDDYVITKFYNPDKTKGSFLHRVLDKVPHYTIKHVDTSLMNLQRSFSVDGTSIYDFLTGECAEQFNCLFVFDSTDRSISVYDLYTVCKDCGHRGEYNDVCPKCGNINLKYFGEDTTIFIDKENLTESVQLETDTGSVKNCFKLEAGDDDMTAAIRSLNPNGTDYIIAIPDWQKEDMPEELVEKLKSYNALYEKNRENYENIIEQMYELIDDILYQQSGMMPTIEHAEVTAKTEAAKLTKANLSPLALSSVTTSTSLSTVESALKNYAKVYVKTGYVKLEIDQSKFTYVGKKLDGWTHGTWMGNFKVTNYSDEEDIAYSSVITVDIHDNYEEFVRQKIMKAISDADDEDGSVFDVLNIASLSTFKESLKLYCLNRLTSFYDAIQSALDVLVQMKQSDEDADLYEDLYLPYYNKLQACQAEIDKRSKTIDGLENQYNALVSNKNAIQKALDFETYLGEELFSIFCLYRREDKYTNSNYISDGLDNAEIFDNARKFLEVANEELYKSSMCQHSISSTLHNLLVMPEFQSIVDKFELGNWIRIGIDDEIYRLRLISYEISFSSIQTLNVEFSDVTKQKDCTSDLKDILDSAQSMATSYSYVEKQSEKGKEAYKTFKDIQEEGWNSALTQINNNTKEEITFGSHGIWAKYFDDTIDDYSPEQLRITHNILAFSSDNWKTVSTALGKHDYYKYTDGKLGKHTDYGLTSNFVTAGYIFGSQIIAGDIYSINYSPTSGSHLNLNDGSFQFAGGNFSYNASTNKMTMRGVTIEWDSSTTPEIGDIDGLTNQLEGIDNYLNQLDGRIQTYSQDTDPSIEWSATDKVNKVGDVWFDTKNDLTKRWNGSSWDVITDSELEALAKSKAQIFTTTPTTPYYVGDLWTQGASGDILNCIKTRTTGNYTASDWAKSSKYTDDTALSNFISGDYADTLDDLNTQIDKRAQTWYLTKAEMDAEVATWTNKAIHVGDLWYRTDATANEDQTFVYNSSYKWEVMNGVPKEIFDMADAKCSLYVSKPSNYKKNDMWVLEIENANGSNSTYPKYEKGTLLVSSKDNSSYSASDWSEIIKYSNKLQDFINNTYADDLENIQGQIDKKANTYYQDSPPHGVRLGESNKEFDSFVGDLWYDTKNKKSYTYTKEVYSSNPTIYIYEWKETDGVPDEVYDLIDGKATIYVSKPTEYYIGDLLIPTSTFKVSGVTFTQGKVYKATKTATSFTTSDWVEIEYTDDTSLNTFINGAYTTALANINTQIDGKADTFYQKDKPHDEYPNVEDNSTYNLYVGDLWFDIKNNKSYMYTKSTASTSGYYNYAWKEIDGVPDSVFDSIDTKKSIYTSLPVSYNVNDIYILEIKRGTWGKGSLLIAKNSKTNQTEFLSSDWTENVRYTDDTKANEALDAANGAQSVADNAKTLGDTLVSGLGFQETEITGKYIISPVIAGGSLLIGDTMGTYAQITTGGKLTCTGADIKGKITATNGTIGGWNISNSIYTSTTDEKYKTVLKVAEKDSDPVFWVADQTTSTTKFPFSLYANGHLYATEANITGKITTNDITATGGAIGGWSINGDSLYNSTTDSKYKTVLSTASSETSPVFWVADQTTNSTTFPYVLYANGAFKATKATIEGKVTATSGKIGNWNISGDMMYAVTDDESYKVYMNAPSAATTLAFYVKDTIANKNTFYVSGRGALYASEANITGKITTNDITATGGAIGGWTINGDRRLQKNDTSAGIYVAFCAPTQLDTEGNSNADVLVVRTGTSTSNYDYPLVLSSDGSLKATKANIVGTINATDGKIGGWSVDSNSLHNATSDGNYKTVLKTATTSSDPVFWIADQTSSTTKFPFQLYANGNCYTQKLNAAGGTVGGWNISSGSINQVSSDQSFQVSLSKPIGSTTYIFYIKDNSSSSATYPFYISGQGNLKTKDITTTGNLTVSGTKNRIVDTSDYKTRSLYCYEMPSPMFGDIGEGKIDETGKCYIFLDDIFAETIDTNCAYQVFLQSYGKGECYVTERTSSYFIVEGTENLSFGWELKAIQKDYDTMRLEEFKEIDENEEETNPLYETYDYLETLLYDVESEEFNYDEY